MKVKRSIATKILLLCLILSVAAAVIVGAASIVISGTAMDDTVQDEMIALADQVSETVEASVNADFNYLEGLATSDVVYGMSDAYAQKEILMNIAADRNMNDLGFIGTDGMTVTAAMGEADLSSREYYQQAMNGNRYCSGPIPDSTKEGVMILMMSVPVYENGDTSTGNIVGVLYGLYDGAYLSTITNQVSFGETGFAYMIDSEGTNIAYTDEEKVINQENALVQFANNPDFSSLIALLNKVLKEDSGYSTYTYNGATKCVGYASTTEFGWHVLVSASQSELFAGQNRSIVVSVIIMIAVAIIAAALSLVFAKKMSKPLTILSNVNSKLEQGDLTTDIPEETKNGQDEITQIAVSSDMFVSKLKEVLTSTIEASGSVIEISEELNSLAEQSSEAAENVAHAVDDISQGTVSQAEDMEKAASEMAALSDAIQNMGEAVEVLTELAADTEKVDRESIDALSDLMKSNEKTTGAFEEISAQINETGKATDEISSAANLITEIASQTNLLSLNASIEAARAGEAGKGFAVVATEIQQLSEQSNRAADTIQKIINELAKGSDASVKKMQEAMVLINEQQEKLVKTKEGSDAVNQNISRIFECTNDIKRNVTECGEVKDTVNEVVMNLSAVSEENAASTEETNAAMEELSANIGVIAESSRTLNDLAQNLKNEVDYWKV